MSKDRLDFPVKQLSKIGDRAESAYLVKSGRAAVSHPSMPAAVLEPPLLIGVLEFFLFREGDVPARMLDLDVEESSETIQISFDTVQELCESFDYGYSANRFLALMLDHTNSRLRAIESDLPPRQREYQERAKTFASIVSELQGLWRSTGEPVYQQLAEKAEKNPIYKEGERLLMAREFTYLGVEALSLKERITNLTAGSVLCRTGDSADGLYILLKGSVAVVQQNNYIASISQPGEAFGEISLFLKGKRTADLVAKEDSTLFHLRESELSDFHQHRPQVFVQIARTLAERVKRNLTVLNSYSRSASESDSHEGAESLRQLVDALLQLKRLGARAELTTLLATCRKNPVITNVY